MMTTENTEKRIVFLTPADIRFEMEVKHLDGQHDAPEAGSWACPACQREVAEEAEEYAGA